MVERDIRVKICVSRQLVVHLYAVHTSITFSSAKHKRRYFEECQ